VGVQVGNHLGDRDIVRQDCPHPPSYYVNRFCVDSAVFDPRSLRLLAEIMGAERVMLGSDYPFALGEPQIGLLVSEAPFLSPAERQRLLGGNAQTFFNLKEEHSVAD
jgi:aminocarboxymuconate-semialdehyde decarboxylase